jgi:C_GCAxxG_C_C family probable redox protein
MGFLVTEAYKGTSVRSFSPEELWEVYTVRAALESLAARLAAARLTEADADRLREILDEMVEAGRKHDLDRMTQLDNDFHGTIIQISGNTLLYQLWQTLRFGYWTIVTAKISSFDLEHLAVRHEELLDALKSRDPEKASHAMQHHIEDLGKPPTWASHQRISRPEMDEQQAVELARATFITEENTHGCAETTLMVLLRTYGLPGATDSSPAMVLNGGVAWSGGCCGAITGAAMAVGRLAAQRITDHKEAKRTARSIIKRLMADFRAEYEHVNCRDLVGLDISSEEGHTAFIEGQVWHTVCMNQIEFTLRKLVALQDDQIWQETIRQFQT